MHWRQGLAFGQMLGLSLASHAAVNWTAYESGELGALPEQYYETVGSTPMIHVERWSPNCQPNEYVFLSPREDRISATKLMILDQSGDLVWQHHERGATNDLRVQRFRGEDYLTYWVGDDDYHGHGHGYYKMLDRTYNLAYTINAVGDVDGDYHEFSITRDHTALITSYVATPANLTGYNRTDGFIWDCVLQELEIETNNLLFEWHAKDHFTFDDMNVNSWTDWTGTKDDPWDWFHLNSVDKDSRGNYLIAARYTNAVSYVDGTTGEVLWNLGGKANDFVDLSEGNATKFIDAHMARWTKSETAITLFDNVAHWSVESGRRQSRGAKIDVDVEKQVARVVTEIVHPEQIFAESEGSVQILENGNYFVGYGSAAIFSEFSPNSTLLCSSHYSPVHVNDSLVATRSYLKSYRVFKSSWTGVPERAPVFYTKEDKITVSWNGATEVRSWKLDGRLIAGPAAGSLKNLGVYGKDGFETEINVKVGLYSSFQLTALDGRSQGLRAWNVHPDGTLAELFFETTTQEVLFLHNISWLLAFLFVCYYLSTRWRRIVDYSNNFIKL